VIKPTREVPVPFFNLDKLILDLDTSVSESYGRRERSE